MVWQFTWGSAADLITAGATVFALFFALKAWRESRRNADAAHAMLVLEQQREDRAETRESHVRETAERAFQADVVTAWVQREEDLHWIVCLVNGSALPVYDAEVRFSRAGTYLGGFGRRLIPPGRAEQPMPSYELGTVMESGQARRESPRDLEMLFLFTDAAGRRWGRGARGQLERASPSETH